jgi:hypothetical protein
LATSGDFHLAIDRERFWLVGDDPREEIALEVAR